MPEIEITESQRDRLEAVQASLESDVVGKYGHVRPSDALEYLLDRYEADVGADDGTDVTDGTAAGDGGDGAATDPTSATGATVETAAGAAEPTAGVAGSEANESDAGGVGAGADGADAVQTAGSETPEAASVSAAGDGANASEDDADAAVGSDAGTGGDDAVLDAMMNLLDRHEDKWGESSSEARYEVELPDGSVEAARTKDDVRGLLFRHSR